MASPESSLQASPSQGNERDDGDPFNSPQFFAEPKPASAQEAALPRVQRNGKLYSKKKANLPFLKKHTWNKPPPSSSSEQDKKKQERMEKESSPPIFERTTQVSRTLLRYTAVIVLGTLLLSRAMTETWTFGYQGKWTNAMNWIPRPVSVRTHPPSSRFDQAPPSHVTSSVGQTVEKKLDAKGYSDTDSDWIPAYVIPSDEDIHRNRTARF